MLFGVRCALLVACCLLLLVVSCWSFIDSRRLLFVVLFFFCLTFVGRWRSLRFVVRLSLRDYCCLLFVVLCMKFAF